MNYFKECLGEFIGTLILVFVGCGAVAVSVLYGTLDLLGVAIVFGLGVSLAIYTVRNICPAHLNPAVSIAMSLSKKLPLKKLPFYWLGQFLGAFIGALLLFLIFEDAINFYEEAHGVVRGSDGSHVSAMMFGEYFPNPAYADKLSVSHFLACFMEGIGTFVLVFVIFKLIEKEKKMYNFIPLFIGLTVTILICLIAPFTQGGFNPARDFSPRIIAYFTGWKATAFPSIQFSFFTVYMLSPLIGASLASFINKRLVKN